MGDDQSGHWLLHSDAFQRMSKGNTLLVLTKIRLVISTHTTSLLLLLHILLICDNGQIGAGMPTLVTNETSHLLWNSNNNNNNNNTR